MPAREVKRYYYAILNQYLEMKESLKDFNEAFEKGYFTEDQLENVKADIARLEENYNRVSYIMYLLEMPNRKEKQTKYKNTNKNLVEYFKVHNADTDSVVSENKSLLDSIREELKTLTKDVTKKINNDLEQVIEDYDEKYSLKSKQN